MNPYYQHAGAAGPMAMKANYQHGAMPPHGHSMYGGRPHYGGHHPMHGAGQYPGGGGAGGNNMAFMNQAMHNRMPGGYGHPSQAAGYGGYPASHQMQVRVVRQLAAALGTCSLFNTKSCSSTLFHIETGVYGYIKLWP